MRTRLKDEAIAPIYTRYQRKLCLEGSGLRWFAAIWTVAVDDWHAPVAPKSPRGDLDAGGRLPPFVLAPVDEADHARHRLGPVAGRHQLVRAQVVLDIAAQDGGELLVGRAAGDVLLVSLQLGL